MAKNGKNLSILALIIALSGVLIGGYTFIQINFIGDEPEYILPTARVFLSGGYPLSSGMPYKLLNYTDKSFDNRDAFNLSSDAYIIPEPGFYHVIAQYSIDALDQDFFIIQITLNEVIVCSCSYTSRRSTNTFGVSIVDIINATIGDSISIRAYIYNNLDDPRMLFAGEAYTFFSIAKLN